MGPCKARNTRKLRSWMVEQVTSGRYPGLVWDDDEQTMFRIPWKHAGKQDFRSDEDAAIFKAWAEFKGKMTDESRNEPAIWKTRLRCALNKSLEFEEVAERAQLDISEPFKVYRLVPDSEQGLTGNELTAKRAGGKSRRRTKRRATESSEEDEELPEKQMKEESVTAPLSVEEILSRGEATLQVEGGNQQIFISQGSGILEEFQLDFRIETNPPPSVAEEDSFHVAVSYSGHEVLSREVQGKDVRITYHTPSPLPPTPAPLMGGFPRIFLPEAPAGLQGGRDLVQLLPCMEKGVVLTSNHTGVYLRRYCRGRVYWIGPHAAAPPETPNKIQRDAEPVLIFSKEAFRQELEAYQQQGGDPPRCDVTLCFGEELVTTDDQSQKLILVKITFPWAEKQVQTLKTMMASFSFLQSLTSQSPTGEITINLVPVEEVF
ncbi:interferon regulatory factor 9 isoform X2 [Gadus morhua]|uniref:interferon regulatory factor 9 isoform X2 n=1 Tax=Gadus morhua TaxID=8049 RepID=UPI0011B5C274|nr:interferon regulatory factor 9 isoform X2 [Gadus morhua]